MFKFFVILALALVIRTCNADESVNCNDLPYNIFECMVIYPMFTEKSVQDCADAGSPCERTNCVYTKTGLMTDGKIDKQKASGFFDRYASQYPVWGGVVDFAKQTCLSDKLLQGSAECPAQDFLHCTIAGFAKTIPESQWSDRGSCGNTRQYVKQCPVCPEKCFAAPIPAGCDNCMGLLITS